MSRTLTHGDKQKAKRLGNAWHWYSNEPKWWRRLQKHKKRRQAVKQCTHQVMTGNTDVLWPLDKKPWIYYW
jgi:hypothetical protein